MASVTQQQQHHHHQQQCDRLGNRGHTSLSTFSGNVAAARRVSRKYRSARREYGRLKAIVPSVSGQKSVSKLTVIEEAIRYIDHLHATLAQRLMADEGHLGSHSASSSTEPDEFVRRLCFGSFLDGRHPSAVLDELSGRGTDVSRQPLSERLPLSQRKIPLSDDSRDCIPISLLSRPR